MCLVFQRTAFVVASLLACAAWGQSPPVSVPSPGEVLGDVEAPRSAEIHGYLRRLAEASPRVYVETLGATEEGRELLLVAVSSEAHLADLDRLANISRALADPRATPPEEAELLAQGAKALVYLLGAVPPGEVETSRALAELAHRLATSEDPDLAEMREQAVLLITPVADPDGYDRTVDWRRTHPGVDVSPPWRGYYASPSSLTDDPALVLPGLEAAAEVVRRFRPQQVRTADGDVSSLLRGLAGVVRVGSELFRGAYARAETSLARGRTEPPFAWVYPPDPSDPVPRTELAELLVRYGVEVHRLQGELVLGDRLFPDGSLLVRSDQPARDLALALLEGRRPPDGGAGSPFVEDPRSLPVLLGARGTAVDDVAVLDVPVQGRDWPPPEEEGRRRRRRREPPPEPPALLEPVLDVDRPEGRVEGFGGGVFLLRDAGQRPLLTARALLADHQVDAADRPFEAGGREYPAGTLLAYAPREAVETAARETGLVFDAPLSVPDVPRHVVDLPRLGILHTWTDTASAGWLRLALDRARVAYQLVSPEDLRRGDLRRRFDALLWPATDGGFRELVHGIDRDLGPLPYRRTDDAPSLGQPGASDDVTGGMGFVGLGELERFVREGGALAVFGNTARPFVDGGLLGDVGRLRSALETGGAEVRAGVTRPGHPLGYGLAPRDAFFVTSGPVWETREGARDLAVLRFGDAGSAAAEEMWERPARPATREVAGVLEEDLPLETPEDGDEGSEEELDVEIVEEAPEPVTPETLPASWKQAGPVVLWGDRAAGGPMEGRPAVLDVPLGEGHLVIFAFDPFPRYLRRSDLRPVWNLLLHWNDLP